MRFDDWLCHHGIKGQKWGIRRTAEELGHITESGNKAAEAVGRLTNRNKQQKSVKNMSDEDLRRVVNRLNMERQYADLTKNQTSRGVEVVKDVLTIAGSTLAIVASGYKIYEGVKKNKKN